MGYWMMREEAHKSRVKLAHLPKGHGFPFSLVKRLGEGIGCDRLLCTIAFDGSESDARLSATLEPLGGNGKIHGCIIRAETDISHAGRCHLGRFFTSLWGRQQRHLGDFGVFTKAIGTRHDCQMFWGARSQIQIGHAETIWIRIVSTSLIVLQNSYKIILQSSPLTRLLCPK